jgi:hypothetical protein
MSNFVQLSTDDCKYLLELIADIDMDIKFTERQRGYTIPKLQKISRDPRNARLAFQDVDYLLELIEDDEDPAVEQQREMTRAALLEIQTLQSARATELENIEEQRAVRRARRSPEKNLQEHFEHVQA